MGVLSLVLAPRIIRGIGDIPPPVMQLFPTQSVYESSKVLVIVLRQYLPSYRPNHEMHICEYNYVGGWF